ncbi:MAG: hypothetical protein GXP45_07830 [bacterium]|nr:hypothetical protein [bacterium]
MQTFAYKEQTKKRKQYGGLHNYIKYHGMMDLIKVSALSLALVFVIVIYLYYVTLASTRGYFLRQAQQKNKQIQFQYEIVKTDLLNDKQSNWGKLHSSNYNSQVVKIPIEVVYVPTNEFSLK